MEVMQTSEHQTFSFPQWRCYERLNNNRCLYCNCKLSMCWGRAWQVDSFVKQSKIKYSRKKRGKVNRLLAGECQLHKRKGSGVISFFSLSFSSCFWFLLRGSFCFLFSLLGGAKRGETNNNRWVELLYCQRWFYENGFWGKVGKERDKRRRRYTEKMSLRGKVRGEE